MLAHEDKWVLIWKYVFQGAKCQVKSFLVISFVWNYFVLVDLCLKNERNNVDFDERKVSSHAPSPSTPCLWLEMAKKKKRFHFWKLISRDWLDQMGSNLNGW